MQNGVTYGVTVWLIIFLATIYLLYRYLAKGTPWSVYFTTGLGWLCVLSVVCLAPLDITKQKKPHELVDSYAAIYWISFVFSWICIPFQMVYIASGYFTIQTKIKHALKANAIFYGLIGLILAAAMISLAATHKNMDFDTILAYLVAVANVWGLTFMVLLLGYGLVEVPRKLWHMSNMEIMYNVLLFKVVRVHDDLDEAKERLDDSVLLVDLATLKVENYMYDFMKQIEGCIPRDKDTGNKMEVAGAPDPTTKLYKKISQNQLDVHVLATLHSQVKHAAWEVKRSSVMWKRILKRATYYKLMIDARDGEDESPAWGDGFKTAIKWRYLMWMQSYILKILAVICGILSIIIVWCEITLAYTKISIVAQIITAVEHDPKATEFFALLFIGYMGFCSMFTMFQLRLSRYYHMHSDRLTDPSTALFNAAYSIRFIFPMGFNFLNLAGKSDDSPAFADVIARSNVIPVLGNKLNLFLPILISIFCCLTLLNVYGKFLRFLKVTRYDYSLDVSQSQDVISEAEHLIKRAAQKIGRRRITQIPDEELIIDTSEGFRNKKGRKRKEEEKSGILNRLFKKDDKTTGLLDDVDDYKDSHAMDDLGDKKQGDVSEGKYDDNNPFADDATPSPGGTYAVAGGSDDGNPFGDTPQEPPAPSGAFGDETRRSSNQPVWYGGSDGDKASSTGAYGGTHETTGSQNLFDEGIPKKKDVEAADDKNVSGGGGGVGDSESGSEKDWDI